jgi:aldehyde dehydrogenase (NAD+)
MPEHGATMAFGGDQVSVGSDGYYMQPVLFTDTTNDMSINRDSNQHD